MEALSDQEFTTHDHVNDQCLFAQAFHLMGGLHQMWGEGETLTQKLHLKCCCGSSFQTIVEIVFDTIVEETYSSMCGYPVLQVTYSTLQYTQDYQETKPWEYQVVKGWHDATNDFDEWTDEQVPRCPRACQRLHQQFWPKELLEYFDANNGWKYLDFPDEHFSHKPAGSHSLLCSYCETNFYVWK